MAAPSISKEEHVTSTPGVSVSADARTEDPSTSHQAARRAQRHGLRDQILAVYQLTRDCGDQGFTDDELQQAFSDHPAGSVSKRRKDLVAMDLVRDSGRRRSTRTGNRAIVWEAVPR